jgi:N-dimethylarginine dimethylaminohydrolase
VSDSPTLAAPPQSIRCESDIAPLGAVAVCRPDPAGIADAGRQPRKHGYRSATDGLRALAEWEAFSELLTGAGVRVYELSSLAEPAVHGARENMHYTRDVLAVVGETCLIGCPTSAARQSELDATQAALTNLGIGAHRLSSRLEFGDVLLADDGLTIVGVGTRTSAEGALELRRRLEANGRHKCLVIDIAALSADVRRVHLDLLLSFVGRRRALMHWPLGSAAAVLNDEGVVRRGTAREMLAGLGISLIPLSPKQQELGAANILSLEPHRVVAYSAALDAGLRELLDEAKVHALSVDGEFLMRTGGGPRCLSAPLERR